MSSDALGSSVLESRETLDQVSISPWVLVSILEIMVVLTRSGRESIFSHRLRRLQLPMVSINRLHTFPFGRSLHSEVFAWGFKNSHLEAMVGLLNHELAHCSDKKDFTMSPGHPIPTQMLNDDFAAPAPHGTVGCLEVFLIDPELKNSNWDG
jgi:hypothetical protein